MEAVALQRRRWHCSSDCGIAAPAEEEHGGVEGDCSLFSFLLLRLNRERGRWVWLHIC
ncbi:hypothetical protein Hanom_Chr11g01038411 [Helianthus anomalus]